MLGTSPLETKVAFWIGPVPIAESVVTTWAIMGLLVALAWLGTRRMKIDPGPGQSAWEIVVETVEMQIRGVIQRDPGPFLPLLGTLFIFLVFANLAIAVPGVKPPTAHIETPAALAIIVFFSVHYFGVRMRGGLTYLRSYTRPNVLLLPLNVVAEFTRTFSLMVRLFGNIMSHEFVIAIVVILAGLLVPIPFLALSILIGLVQAYIFTVLATVFIGAAVGSMEEKG